MLLSVILVIIAGVLGGGAVLWLYGERWRLLRFSTRKFAREGGLRQLLGFKGLHGYVYGRWIKEYIHVLIHYVIPRLGPG